MFFGRGGKAAGGSVSTASPTKVGLALSFAELPQCKADFSLIVTCLLQRELSVLILSQSWWLTSIQEGSGPFLATVPVTKPGHLHRVSSSPWPGTLGKAPLLDVIWYMMLGCSGVLSSKLETPNLRARGSLIIYDSFLILRIPEVTCGSSHVHPGILPSSI